MKDFQAEKTKNLRMLRKAMQVDQKLKKMLAWIQVMLHQLLWLILILWNLPNPKSKKNLKRVWLAKKLHKRKKRKDVAWTAGKWLLTQKYFLKRDFINF